MLGSIRDAIRGDPRQKAIPWGALTEEVYGGVVELLADQRLIGKPPVFREFYQPAGLVSDGKEP
jgi:hypothetical protein